MVLYSASTTEVCYARIFCLRNWSSFICLGPGKCVVQDSLSVSEAKLEDGDVLMAGASEQPEQRYPASIVKQNGETIDRTPPLLPHHAQLYC